MKKSIITVTIFFILIAIIPNLVNAENETNIKYYIPEVGMAVDIPNDFYDIIQGLENNDERVEKYKNSEQNFKQMGIAIDALDSLEEDATKEIVVAISKNTSTKKVDDFRNVPDDQIEQFSESFFESIKQQSDQVEFLETKVITTSNGNKYMTLVTKTQLEGKAVNSIIYYTIVNQQLVGVTIRYLNKDIDLQEARKYS